MKVDGVKKFNIRLNYSICSDSLGSGMLHLVNCCLEAPGSLLATDRPKAVVLV